MQRRQPACITPLAYGESDTVVENSFIIRMIGSKLRVANPPSILYRSVL